MKLFQTFFCLAVGLVLAKAISISGGASFNASGISAGGSLAFPRIPGINAPLGSLFGLRPTSARTPASSSTGATPASSLMSSLRDLFDIPDPKNLIPDLSSNANSPGVQIPSMSGLLPDVSSVSSIPGVATALQEARDEVTRALNLGANFTLGIETTITDAFASNDPTTALRDLISTILNAYLTVAANCPLIIIGARVLQEGIRLAIEVARSISNIIFGTTTTTMAP